MIPLPRVEIPGGGSSITDGIVYLLGVPGVLGLGIVWG